MGAYGGLERHNGAAREFVVKKEYPKHWNIDLAGSFAAPGEATSVV